MDIWVIFPVKGSLANSTSGSADTPQFNCILVGPFGRMPLQAQ